MKKFMTLIEFALVNIYSAFAQNNSLTMISEGDEKIFLELDGKRQNTTAEKKVKAVGLNKVSYKVKVVFENNALPACERTLEFTIGGNLASNMDYLYAAGKDGNGGSRIRFSSMNKAAGAAPVETYGYSSVSTMTFKSSDTTKKQLQPVNSGSTTSSGSVENYGYSSVSTMTFKSSDTTKKQLKPVNAGTTTRSGSVENYGYSSVSTVTFKSSDTEKKQLQPVNSSTQSTARTSPASSNTNNSGGCAAPMQASDFKASKKSVSNSTFEDGKLEAAKQIADNNCLSVDQIIEINDKFTFEDTRLTFAKYCYAKCFDKKNYSRVSGKFTFESNKKELAEYIKGK